MRVQDLMIGDWVTIKDEKRHGKVTQICITQYMEGGEWDEELCIDDFCNVLRNIDPVPLTPEILDANGFETIDHNNGYVDKVYFAHVDAVKRHNVGQGKLGSRRIRLTFFKDINKVDRIDCYISGVSRRVIRGEIYFVHELQDALRFCGLDDLADKFKIE